MHPVLGTFALYTVPVCAPTGGTQTYEAIVNDAVV
jgi:hypothetical protein